MLEDILNMDSYVFKNQDIFNINYVPETIQCRDNELKSIFMNIKPLINNGKSLNTFILGNAGTGKTTVVKKALREIEEYTTLKTCYINCNVQNTTRKCYFQIYKTLLSYDARPNISTEVIQEAIMNKLEKESFVLAIDDINNLSKDDYNNLLNEFFRINEFYHVNLSMIITANESSFKSTLERNALSIFLGHEIVFENYTSDQIYTILKHRCDVGFNKGIIKDSQIRKISEYIVGTNTIRSALSLLNILGQQLESENRESVTADDINKLIEKLETDYKR